MKKLILALISILMLLSVGCGKSTEATKADELILSIGNVDLQSKDIIQSARLYYDLLTDKQKSEVENYSILEKAESDLAILIAEDEATKQAEEEARLEAERQEAENERIYSLAVECDEQNQIDKAYDYYLQLPESYKDVKQRMDILAPYVGICGTWVCDVQLAKAKNSREWRPLFSTLTITLDSSVDNKTFVFKYEGKVTTIDSKHILFNKVDMWAAMGHDKGWFYNCTVQTDGSRMFEKQGAMGSTDMGTLYEQFTFLSQDKMQMNVSISKSNIEVSFPYTKQN